MKDISEFREKWKHEDELINQRLTWLLFTQTILFAGYANILSKELNSHIETFLLLMSIFGILFCCVIGVSVAAAIYAMFDLKKQAKQSDITTKIDSSLKATKWGLLASITLPILFLMLWVAILIINLVSK
jgi:hypothetical protein